VKKKLGSTLLQPNARAKRICTRSIHHHAMVTLSITGAMPGLMGCRVAQRFATAPAFRFEPSMIDASSSFFPSDVKNCPTPCVEQRIVFKNVQHGFNRIHRRAAPVQHLCPRFRSRGNPHDTPRRPWAPGAARSITPAPHAPRSSSDVPAVRSLARPSRQTMTAKTKILAETVISPTSRFLPWVSRASTIRFAEGAVSDTIAINDRIHSLFSALLLCAAMATISSCQAAPHCGEGSRW